MLCRTSFNIWILDKFAKSNNNKNPLRSQWCDFTEQCWTSFRQWKWVIWRFWKGHDESDFPQRTYTNGEYTQKSPQGLETVNKEISKTCDRNISNLIFTSQSADAVLNHYLATSCYVLHRYEVPVPVLHWFLGLGVGKENSAAQTPWRRCCDTGSE